jgi:hypothetical protein
MHDVNWHSWDVSHPQLSDSRVEEDTKPFKVVFEVSDHPRSKALTDAAEYRSRLGSICCEPDGETITEQV